MSSRKELVGVFQIIFSLLFYGFIPILVKYGKNFGIYDLAFYRLFITSIIFLVIIFYFKKNFIKIFNQERKKIIVFGILLGLDVLFYFISIERLSVSVSVLLLGSVSVWAILFSRIFLKEKILKRTIISMFLVILGIFFVVFSTSTEIRFDLIGLLAGVLASICFAGFLVVYKTFKEKDVIVIVFWQYFIGALILFPLIFLQPLKIEIGEIIIPILLGVFTVIGGILYFKGFQKVNVQKIAVLSPFEPFFAIIFAIILLNEELKILTIIGGFFIILGSYFSIRTQKIEIKELT